jgi:serine protease Do
MGQKDKLDIGLSVSDLTPQLREEFQIPDAIENHPIVLEIQNDSPALRSGIRPGDLILDVNRKEVKTAKEVLSSLHKGTNTIRIARGEGIRIFVLDSK